MNAQDCLQMLREIKDVSFATVDEKGMPHNRIIDVMIVEEDRLVFCTGRGKDFYHQLIGNPHVAISALNKNWQMIRLTGAVRKLDDQKKWIDRIFEENPSMNDVYPGESRYILDPFAIESGAVEFFDLGTSPIHRESFSFGESKVQAKGFRITDACIGCGTCQRNCPQQAIDAGMPYVIRQDSCLHCGLCYENCPVQAIINRNEE
ncbi:4Fe-4S binding protein [Catenisphaera adipataccumulans]|uniref:Putative pyridoxamine 5'-phosphate oxidase family protein n=1 Tax=Catenisphaera adipataccumulans TaxID=700500 RepID=A0A7W8CXN4_9FIRM|nr:4Fe-4S binding protein [Catenisphaera adipataccumulans]MBB5182147.1 putative pyridoxamine 5'-phosphate oxidase family protein [Catenisphaera adipataccumulans]